MIHLADSHICHAQQFIRRNMPTKIDGQTVEALVASYKAIPEVEKACLVSEAFHLSCFGCRYMARIPVGQVGLNFVLDHSGKLFKGKKCTLKDVVANTDDTRQAYIGNSDSRAGMIMFCEH